MHRRRVLQMGAALATLPLAGCGPAAPDPNLAGVDQKNTTHQEKTVTDQVAAPPQTPTATASSDPAPPDPPPPVQEEPAKSPFARVIGKVGKNHGHLLTVSFDDVKAGLEKSYNLVGTSNHPHTVTLSPDDMKNLLAGQIIRRKSSRDRQHAHRLLVRCAPPVDPPEWIPACEAGFSGQDEHEAVIPAADIAAKLDKTYDVQGIAGHPHDILLTASHFQKLEKGEAVSVLTTRDPDDAHLHTVFIQYRRPKASAG